MLSKRLSWCRRATGGLETEFLVVCKPGLVGSVGVHDEDLVIPGPLGVKDDLSAGWGRRRKRW